MPEKQKKNSISINKYKTKRELNIGTLIFALIFIYLVVAVVAYATEKRITVYEVREGSILKDHSYTGLILREETLVNAESDGYVNYYQSGQSKIRTGMNICVISPQKLDVSESQEQSETTLSAEEQETIVLKAQDFNENFTSQKFSSVYSLKRDVAETLQNASDQTKTAQLDAVIAASGQDVKTYPAARDGVMVLTYDGEEGLTKDNFTDADFDKSMIRYADKRYLNVELILEDQSGLKIPKSSVIKKSCYAIPQDYITTGGNSSDSGVMIQDKDSAVFQQIEIYYVSDDGTNYVNPESLKAGTTLIKPESSETMTVEKTAELSGVYNINQGYAVFNAVEILCESDEYYIIKEGNSYGLSNYDHIVQDGEDVKEDEVVF